MRKSELIRLLEEIEGDPEVFLSRDEEGNAFNALYDVADSMMYGLEYGREEFHPVHPDDIGTEYDEDELSRGIVLWP